MKTEMWDQLTKVIGTEESSLAGTENTSQLDQREDAKDVQPARAPSTQADLRPSHNRWRWDWEGMRGQ